MTAWKCESLPEDSIKPPAASDNSLLLGYNYINNAKIRITFNCSCLKQGKISQNDLMSKKN